MGFRCPICHEDFAQDHDAWKGHVDTEHIGVSKMLVDGVREIAEGREDEEAEATECADCGVMMREDDGEHSHVGRICDDCSTKEIEDDEEE